MLDKSSLTVTASKAIIIGVDTQRDTQIHDWNAYESLQELKELAKTAGLETCGEILQKRPAPHSSFYLGRGKLDELKELLTEKEAEVVISDDELSPKQYKNLEKILEVKILDRTSLILHIFAQRAQTKEAQLQVELAQLQYLRPRLTRMWTHLSRLGGGIGTRGPGESQLEVDKRLIGTRIKTIKEKIQKVQSHRMVNREKRQLIPLVSGAIVGYTNAGKSTLLNTLSNANVLAEDKLFATLDPTTRQIEIGSNDPIVLTDTVGFIQKLPTQLVTAFRATLEEVLHADFLLHVVDISSPNIDEMVYTVNELIAELGAKDTPQLYVFNKADTVKYPKTTLKAVENYQPQVWISAKDKHNIDALLNEIQHILAKYRREMTFYIPYNRMDIVNLLHKHGRILEEHYENEITIKVDINIIIGEKITGALHKAKE